jgi:hypothetical protein
MMTAGKLRSIDIYLLIHPNMSIKEDETKLKKNSQPDDNDLTSDGFLIEFAELLQTLREREIVLLFFFYLDCLYYLKIMYLLSLKKIEIKHMKNYYYGLKR